MVEKMQRWHPASDWQRVSGLAAVDKLCLEWARQLVLISKPNLGISLTHLTQNQFLHSLMIPFFFSE